MNAQPTAERMRSDGMRMHGAAVLAFAITVLVAPPAFAQSESCVYTSSTLAAEVRVRPPRTPPLSLHVEGVPIEVRPDRHGHDQIAVNGALEFRGEGSVSYAFVRAMSANGGIGWVRPSTLIAGVSSGRAGVVVDYHLLGEEVLVSGLALACSDIAPGHQGGENVGPREGEAPIPSGIDTDRRVWRIAPREVTVHAGPGTGPTVRVRFLGDTPHGSLRLVRLERRGRWTRVDSRETTTDEGFSGWVLQAQLRPEPPGHGYGTVCCDDRPWGQLGHPREDGAMGPPTYIGTATAVAGTAVSAAGGRGQWATLRASTGLEVSHVQDSAWVAIRAITGISGFCDSRDVCRAWIPRSAVTFPDRARYVSRPLP